MKYALVAAILVLFQESLFRVWPGEYFRLFPIILVPMVLTNVLLFKLVRQEGMLGGFVYFSFATNSGRLLLSYFIEGAPSWITVASYMLVLLATIIKVYPKCWLYFQ